MRSLRVERRASISWGRISVSSAFICGRLRKKCVSLMVIAGTIASKAALPRGPFSASSS
jgi:hypothetical protein